MPTEEQRMKVHEIIKKLDQCSEQECKGILYFVVGYMSGYPGCWNLFADACKTGINANTWERLTTDKGEK